MAEKKFMQYNRGQDDLVETMSLEEYRSHPLIRAIFGEDIIDQYANLLDFRGISKVKLNRGVNHNLKEEIALYNTLLRMEKRNPSISRIREEANVSYDRGMVTRRDFETNQPVYRENAELTPELKRTLDNKLGPEIGGELMRSLWLDQLGFMRDQLDEAYPVGRSRGVVAEKP